MVHGIAASLTMSRTPVILSDETISRWEGHDARPQTTATVRFDYSQHIVTLRTSPVDVGGMFQIYQFMETRGLVDKLGRPYARMMLMIKKRITLLRSNPVIHQVFVEARCPYFDMPTRIFSGINKLPNVPRVDIADFLSHELNRNIPRSMMGKSIFDMQSKLYRIAFRNFGVLQAMPLSCSYRVVEADFNNAQVSILGREWSDHSTDSDGTLAEPFINYWHDRDETIVDTMALLNHIASPPLIRSNVKKFYISSMANSKLRGMLQKCGRTLTNPTDTRVQEAETIFNGMRSAAVSLVGMIERRFPDAARAIRAYANEHNKDYVACLLRRFCNIKERDYLESDITAIEWSAHVQVGWPDDGAWSLIDREHDGMAWLLKTGGADIAARELDAFHNLLNPPNHMEQRRLSYSFKVHKPSQETLMGL